MKNGKRRIALALSMGLVLTGVCGIPGLNSQASELNGLDLRAGLGVETNMDTQCLSIGQWTHPGNNMHYLEGTNITARVENKCVYIEGTGEIPDFNVWKLYERPWAGVEVEYVHIAPTITSIGAYSFYNIPTLKRVELYSTTFIDETSFEGIAHYPIFRVHTTIPGANTRIAAGTEPYMGANGSFSIDKSGNVVTFKEVTPGGIKYTSLDSLKAYAQSNVQGASFIMDDKKQVESFQNSTNPTLKNVYYASEVVKYKDGSNEIEESPWNNIDRHSNGGKYTPVLRVSKQTPDNAIQAMAQMRYQGKECMKAFSVFKGDYEYATSYTVNVTKPGFEHPLGDYKLTRYELDIPKEYQASGRQFKLLAIGSGTVYNLDDLDTNPGTITFETSKPSTAYALLYKDVLR